MTLNMGAGDQVFTGKHVELLNTRRAQPAVFYHLTTWGILPMTLSSLTCDRD